MSFRSKSTVLPGNAAIVAALLRCLDRPAFRTPFNHESSLPRFRTALAETIDTLNTGRLASGAMIPSRNMVKDATKQAALAHIVEAVVGLRAAFDQLLRDKEIRPCPCGQPDCPTFMFSATAVRLMDDRRHDLLESARRLDARFAADFYGI